MKPILAVTLLLLCAPVLATTLAKLELETFLKRADVVALVHLESAELVLIDGEGCGAKYRGRVTEAIKGSVTKGGELVFGPYEGKGIGNDYLVFATKKAQNLEPKRSTNGMAIAEERDFEARCFEALPPYREMHGGFGTLEVSWTTKFDYKDAVLFKEEWVEPPSGLKKKKWAPDDNEIISERSWIRIEDVLEFLKARASKGAP